MAHNDNETSGHGGSLERNQKALPVAPTPKKPGKRSAEDELGESTSTPMCSAKKPFLESDQTSVSAVSLNVSSLNQSTCSSRSRTVRSSMMRITRGVQTIAPETFNRYCQVTSTRVPKPMSTVSQQTDAVFVLSEPLPPPPPMPEKALSHDASCQTSEPVVQEACIGTSQIDSPVWRVDGWCQTKSEDQSMPLSSSTPIRATVAQLEKDNTGSVDSFATMLNNLAKEFGIELSSVEQQQMENDNKKKRKGGKQKVPDSQVILQENLVNKATKAITQQLEQKMSSIVKAHLDAYSSKICTKRDKFIEWMKAYQTRQQKLEANIRMRAPRRVLVVRKRMRRPAAREKSVQCDTDGERTESSTKEVVSVGTQWQRQRQTMFCLRLMKPNPPTPQALAKDPCGKPSYLATLKKCSSSSNSSRDQNNNNKENVPPNYQ